MLARFTKPPDLVQLRKKPYPRRDIMAALARPGCAEALGKLIPALDVREAMRRAREWNEERDKEETARKLKEAGRRARKRMAAQSCGRAT